MCIELMTSIKVLQEQYDINHKRIQKARRKEDDMKMRKFRNFEKLLRPALKIYKDMELAEKGIDVFCPQDNFFV